MGAYKRSKNTCARTWRSKRGGGSFLGEYGIVNVNFHRRKFSWPCSNLQKIKILGYTVDYSDTSHGPIPYNLCTLENRDIAIVNLAI